MIVCECGCMCNFNLDSNVCLSSAQAGLISQGPPGQLQGRSDVGESETFRMTDSCHPELDQPCSLRLSSLLTKKKKKRRTRSTCLHIHQTRCCTMNAMLHTQCISVSSLKSLKNIYSIYILTENHKI